METVNNLGYKWTGHPLVDMGIATLTAFSELDNPEQLTGEHLEKFAEYAEQAYFSPLLSGYLTVLFTTNFLNPSWKPDKKKQHVKNLLRSYKLNGDEDLPPCTFCGRSSIRLPYLNADRGFLAYRDLIPMLSGEAVINFFPKGRFGLPVCGLCTVAIQALVIGAPYCEGKALIIYSDNPLLLLNIVKMWLPEQRARIQLSLASGEKPKWSRPLTRVIDAMATLENLYIVEGGRLTIYILSNSGQGPSIEMYELPASITSFFMKAQSARYRNTWNVLIKNAWESPERGKSFEEEKPRLRNYLYEDLFRLPDEAPGFIRKYFLRQSIRFKREYNDKQGLNYHGWQEAEIIKWDLTELFLKEVLGMEKQRIESIKMLADQIADDIVSSNDRSLWWKIYSVQNFQGIRNLLITQNRKSLQNGKKPIITFDQFLNIFEEGEELARADWRLAWDLLLIRVIEQLYQKKWFEQNKEALVIEEEK